METPEVLKSKRNIFFISAAVLALIILIVYLIYSSATAPQIEIPELSVPDETEYDLTTSELQQLEQALSEIEQGLLQSNKFNYLFKQDRLPVEIGSLGNEQPFTKK